MPKFFSIKEALGVRTIPPETAEIKLNQKEQDALAFQQEKKQPVLSSDVVVDKPIKPNLERQKKIDLKKVQEDLVFAKTLVDFQVAMNKRIGLGEINAQEEAALSLKFLSLVLEGENIPDGMNKAHWAILKKIASAKNRGEFWEAVADIEDLTKLTSVERQAISWKNQSIIDGPRAWFQIDRRKASRAMEILEEIDRIGENK